MLNSIVKGDSFNVKSAGIIDFPQWRDKTGVFLDRSHAGSVLATMLNALPSNGACTGQSARAGSRRFDQIRTDAAQLLAAVPDAIFRTAPLRNHEL
jgi:hypothetical protein